MITLPILILAIVLYSWKEAEDDNSGIKKTNADGTKFSHYDPDRYIVAGVFTLIMAGFAQTWWALLYFPITWAVFTISFRWILNRKRGMDWRYISPSNVYDWRWIRMSIKHLWKSERFVVDGDEDWMSYTDFYSKHRYGVHRAGRMAYAFEATILLASLTIYITKTM